MGEIVQPGVNGFLVETIDEAVIATNDVARLDRATVRRSIEGRFEADRMIDDYLRLYRQVIAEARWPDSK
jgi:glycogen synthase